MRMLNYCEKCKITYDENLGSCDCSDPCRKNQTPSLSESKLSDLLDGNGSNQFCIIVKCNSEVYRDEWAELMVVLNEILASYDNGKFGNVGAYLEDVSD